VRQLAVELGHLGIRVNGVSPGAIATEMTRTAWEDPAVAAERMRPIALRSRAEPRAVSDTIRFLASDAARYITGATVWVDGGLRLGLFRETAQQMIGQRGTDGAHRQSTRPQP
jgi:NAD(P)-dependent dehydrogenase (short-subunit alcohol dehydrogenase family)